MAYELLNSAQVTPARLYALLKLVVRLQTPRREDLFELLQPAVLFSSRVIQDNVDAGANQEASRNVYAAARNCRLVEEVDDGRICLQEGVEKNLQSLDTFRALMQERVWNATQPEQNNYLLNLYSAWYIVQNERVFSFEDKDFETRFNLALFEDVGTRIFNMTKFNGWRGWAPFLGIGWPMKPNIVSATKGREILIPDASNRLKPIISLIFKKYDKKILEFRLFMQELAQACPELDGGALYLKCQAADRSEELHDNYLSLALSTGLRQLHYSGFIALIREADSTDTFQLYPAEGHPLNLKQVTHLHFPGVA